MKIVLLGKPGCATCAKLETDTFNALAKLGIDAEVEHIFNQEEVSKYGAAPPAFILNGVVKTRGSAPSMQEIINILKNEANRIETSARSSQGCSFCK